MLVRRLSVGALSFLAVLSIMATRVSPESGDKQLARVKGIVGYQMSDPGDFKAIFGKLDLPDNAYAVTRPNGQAVLRLKDSSEIDIGSNTTVEVGEFNAISSGQQNSIALKNGALHFNIRHPEGGQSNYKFVTATSQIAVRGTEGFLVAGASGTQVVCVSCAVGDVTVQVGNSTISVVTGQTLTVIGSSPLTAVSSVTTNSAINNPAVNQFNANQNPFTTTPQGTTLDPTSSLSGTGGSAAGSGIAGGTAAVAGGAGAAVAGAAVASSSGKSTPAPSPAPSPAPTNTPTPTPGASPGPLVVQVSFPGANASFPVAFNWPFSQQNAPAANATANCAPSSVITCTVVQALSGATLNGAINGNLTGPGTFTVSASANGYTVGPVSFSVYGGVTSSVTSLNFTSLTPQQITVSQNPAGTSLTATYTCAPGASMSVTPGSGVSPLTLTVTPVSSPTTPSTAAACTLTVAGQGGTSASTLAIPVNITTTDIGISAHRRRTF
jgi:hypothetical protein